MKKQTLIFEFACSIERIFAFTTNPENTPLWINSISREWIVGGDELRVGSIFQQAVKGNNGQGPSFSVSEFVCNRIFALKQLGTPYRCCYEYLAADGSHGTLLTYSEWNEDGSELTSPMDWRCFEMLRQRVEPVHRTTRS